jgi:hypothetical protein
MLEPKIKEIAIQIEYREDEVTIYRIYQQDKRQEHEQA